MRNSAAAKGGLNQPAATTIFVVEDDPEISATLTKALEASGYRVLSASTGAEARALFGKVQPDLIILDLMLPDDDGLALTGSFRSLTSAPIVICSARHGQVDRALGLQLGAVDFVIKPFDIDDLETRVEAALHSSRLPEVPSPSDNLLMWRSRGADDGLRRK